MIKLEWSLTLSMLAVSVRGQRSLSGETIMKKLLPEVRAGLTETHVITVGSPPQQHTWSDVLKSP